MDKRDKLDLEVSQVEMVLLVKMVRLVLREYKEKLDILVILVIAVRMVVVEIQVYGAYMVILENKAYKDPLENRVSMVKLVNVVKWVNKD